MKLLMVLSVVLVQGATALQIRKLIKTHETEGISIGYWWAVLLGLCGYTIYAVHINAWLFIIANAVGAGLCLVTIVLYYRFTDIHFLPLILLVVVCQIPLEYWRNFSEYERDYTRHVYTMDYFAKPECWNKKFRIWEEIKDGMWQLHIDEVKTTI